MDVPLTLECNNNCLTCVKGDDIKENCFISRDGDVGFNDFKIFVSRVEKEEHITVSGGEPTVSENFIRAIKHIRKKFPKKFLQLLSNGRIFSYKKFSEKLKEIEKPTENFRIGIPVFSHKQWVHDAVTRVRGSFDQTVEGLHNLLEEGYEVEIRVIVNRLNYKHLKELGEWIADEFEGFQRVVFINMKYTGNAEKNIDKIGVKISESNPYVCKAVDSLEGKGIESLLFHFPLCTVPERYRSYAEGVTKDNEVTVLKEKGLLGEGTKDLEETDRELVYLERCGECSVKEDCPMIWSSYIRNFGADEFKPVD